MTVPLYTVILCLHAGQLVAISASTWLQLLSQIHLPGFSCCHCLHCDIQLSVCVLHAMAQLAMFLCLNSGPLLSYGLVSSYLALAAAA